MPALAKHLSSFLLVQAQSPLLQDGRHGAFGASQSAPTRGKESVLLRIGLRAPPPYDIGGAALPHTHSPAEPRYRVTPDASLERLAEQYRSSSRRTPPRLRARDRSSTTKPSPMESPLMQRERNLPFS